MKTAAKYLFWATLAGIVIGGAGQLRAHADPGGNFAPEVIAYTAQHATAICHSLDTDPTLEGVEHAGLHIVTRSSLTAEQAGEVLGLSVRTRCAQHTGLMARFAATYATLRGVVI